MINETGCHYTHHAFMPVRLEQNGASAVDQHFITLDEGKQVVSTFVLRYCPDEGL